MSTIQEEISSRELQLIVFGTSGCAQCKMLFAALQRYYEGQNGLSLSYLDYFEHSDQASEWGIQRLVPYSVIVKNGELLRSFSGNRSAEIIEAISAFISTSEG